MCSIVILSFLCLSNGPATSNGEMDGGAEYVVAKFAEVFCEDYDLEKVEVLLNDTVGNLKEDEDDGFAYIKRNGPMLKKGKLKIISIIGLDEGSIDEWLLKVREAAPDYYRNTIPADKPSKSLTKKWPNLFEEMDKGGVPFCIVAQSGQFRGGFIVVVKRIMGEYKITLVDDK